MDPDHFERQCMREVHELHAFFEGWFGGTLPESAEHFERFTGSIEACMTLISADGTLLDHDQLVTWIWRGYGSEPGFRMGVDCLRGRLVTATTAVVTYREWQKRAAGPNRRRATAFFVQRASAANGASWLHVQETWLPTA